MSQALPTEVHRLLSLMGSQRGWMMAGIALAVIAALSAIGLMAISGWFIAAMAIAGTGGVPFNYYTPAALIRGFAIVRTGGRYGERLVTHDATLRVLSGLRAWLFRCLIPLAPARLHALRSADLFARLRADVDALEHFYLDVLIPIVVAVTGVVLLLLLSFILLPASAWVLAVAAVLAGFSVPWWIQRRAGSDAREMVLGIAKLRGLSLDALRGHAELEAWGAADAHAAYVAELDEALAMRRKRLDCRQALGGAIVMLLSQWAVPALLVFGLTAVHQRTLTGPTLALLVLLTMGTFELITPLPEALARWQSTKTAAGRVLAITDARPAIVEPLAPALISSSPAIRFDHVRMRYAENAPWALNGINLEVAPGERLAIVGASGAGKSSVLNVLQKFYPIQDGRVLFDGQPLNALHGNDVRRRIAVIAQRSSLFNLSLRDNLLLAAPRATPAQMERAIHDAQLDDFVSTLPLGYDTVLGEGGSLVSGGEARRITVARALLQDAPVLILDEPTEGLDASTALQLYQALVTATRGRSVLLITHRLEGLARLVDNVAIMRAGRITERIASAAYRKRNSSAAAGGAQYTR